MINGHSNYYHNDRSDWMLKNARFVEYKKESRKKREKKKRYSYPIPMAEGRSAEDHNSILFLSPLPSLYFFSLLQAELLLQPIATASR